MKFSITFALFAVFAFSACEINEPPRQTRRYPAQTSTTTTTTQYQQQPQPFPDDIAPQPQPPLVTETAPVMAPTVAPTTTTTKSDPPYGVPVPGKPGFVTSPFSPDKLTDVRGYAPGTEVKDPYTGKIFLVP
ncbi:hypothetical protein BH20VER2_BH20VER2_02850 [soil metagenome]|nr:hypothetical protein [Chthoniobacterales bacterium]